MHSRIIGLPRMARVTPLPSPYPDTLQTIFFLLTNMRPPGSRFSRAPPFMNTPRFTQIYAVEETPSVVASKRPKGGQCHQTDGFADLAQACVYAGKLHYFSAALVDVGEVNSFL